MVLTGYNPSMSTVPKILMVDDDVDLEEIVSLKLQAEGFWVKTVNDPVLALQEAKTFRPDLVLLDVNMPGMNGTEYLIELKSIPDMKHAKVVFFTSMSNPWPILKDRDAVVRELGAADFIEKSADLGDVVKKIRETLRKE